MGETLHYPSYWAGLRHGMPLASPWRLLEAAVLRAEPWQRQAVLAAWRAEYPLYSKPTQRQRDAMAAWGVRW